METGFKGVPEKQAPFPSVESEISSMPRLGFVADFD